MRTLRRVLIVCLSLYFGITLLIVTPALNILPGWYVEKHYGRQLDTGFVLLNPFKLSLDITRAELSEPGGGRFLALADSSINLSAASLWQTGWVLDELRVQDLFVRVALLEDERFNFSDLLPAESDEPEPETDSPLLGLTISVVDIRSEAIVLVDQSREEPYEGSWDGLTVHVEDLSTVLEEGKPYRFGVSGPGGGRLEWAGVVSLPLQYSDGTLNIDNLSLNNLWRLAQPWLEFQVDDGRLDVSGNYQVSWGEPLNYEITGGQVRLYDLDVVPRAGQALEDTSLRLRELRVADIAVTGASEDAAVGKVTVAGLAVNGWSEGSRVSVVEMLAGSDGQAPTAAPASGAPPATGAPPQAAPVTATASTPPPTETGETTVAPTAAADPQAPADSTAPGQAPMAQPPTSQEGGWSASIAGFELVDSAVQWRSEYTEPAQLSIAPIAFSAQNLNWPPAGESPMNLTLAVNDDTQLSLSGTLDLGSGDGAIDYSLSELPLPWFNPNLPEPLHATISAGTVSVNGRVELEAFSPSRVALDGGIHDFSSSIRDLEDSLTGWESVDLKGLEVDLTDRLVSLQEMHIGGYYGRLHIAEDGSVNASKIWREELGADVEEAADTAAAEVEQATAAVDHERDDEQVGEQIGEQSADTAPWQFDLQSIVIADSQIDFMDRSLPIPFRALVGDLEGGIRSINSLRDEPADVDIKGSVDGYAPVSLTGTVSPFAEPTALDLTLTFTGVDMALLSPYAATYAGYKIDSGVLDLTLQYALENNRLQGRNQLRLDQLQLGEKVASEKAIDAPLELAIAIMTDASGVIDLTVPVSGDVDDPSFHIGSVVARAFVGIITKAVTAPFNLLANLVGAEADLRLIAFPVGSSTLDEGASAKLDDLAEALQQRPKLKLAVTGKLTIDADREQLQQDALEAALIEAGLTPESVKNRDEDYTRAIERRFSSLQDAARGTSQGALQDASPDSSPDASQDTGVGVDPQTLSTREKRLQVARSITISDEQLLSLARERAVAVKSYLVNEGGIAADQVVVRSSSLDAKENRFSGAELDIR